MFHLPQQIVPAPVRRAVSLVLMLMAISMAVGMAYWAVHVRALKKALIQDTLALLSDPMVRPSHVSPALEGSFADWVQPHLAGLAEASRQVKALTQGDWQLALSVMDGTKPYSQVPPAVRRLLRRSRPAVAGLLRATRAASAQPPNCVLDHELIPAGRCPDVEWYLYEGARLGILDARRLLAECNADAALEEIMDVLALSHDLSRYILVGDQLAAHLSRWAFSACTEALDRASPTAKSYALLQLQIIEEGRPSMASVLKQDIRYMKLATFVKNPLPADIKTTPQVLAALAEGKYDFTSNPSKWLWWNLFEMKSAKLQAAVMLPARERDKKIERPDWNFRSYDIRHRCATTRLHMLRAAALVDLSQAEEGRWPASVALNPAPGQAEQPPIALQVEGDTAWVRTTALTPEERDICEIEPAIHLHRDGALR